MAEVADIRAPQLSSDLTGEEKIRMVRERFLKGYYCNKNLTFWVIYMPVGEGPTNKVLIK